MSWVYLTRVETFSAAHRLYNPRWTAEENDKVFGMCANPNFHGHNYTLHVTLKGKLCDDTGFIVNVKDLRDIIREDLFSVVDHKNFNLDVPYFKERFPSVEQICIFIWELLEKSLQERGIYPQAQLHKIRLEETASIYAEYMGEE